MLKTAQDANGTDVHLRLYAPWSGHLTDPRFGAVVIATAHLDRGEGNATPPRLHGFSEEAERRVADLVASRLGWHVQPTAWRSATPSPNTAIPPHPTTSAGATGARR